MTSSRTRALAVVLACIMVLSVVAAAPASAGGDENKSGDGTDTETNGDDQESDGQKSDDGTDGTSYHLKQGGKCIDLEALQDDKTVTEFYNWSADSSHRWSSQGTTHIQEAETSLLFLYEAPDGTVSLVIVHEKVGNDGGNGGAASFTFEGMPAGSWAVQDDSYDGPSVNYDTWDTEGSKQSVDWAWEGRRTDGGAYESLGDDFGITIDPAFNENARLHGKEYEGEGRVDEWELLSGDQSDPKRHSLDLNEEVQIGTGSCQTGDGTSSYPRFEVTDESINRTEVTVGEPVNVTVNVTNEGTASGEYAGLFQADLERVDTKYANLGAGETETLSFVTTFDEPDTYGLRVRTDHVGRVAVHPRPDPAADARLTGSGTIEANVTHVRAGSTVATDLPEANGSTVAVDRLNVTAANDTDRMAVEVDYLDSPGNDTNASFRTGVEPVEYLELTHDDPSAFGNATLDFSVERDTLAGDADPEDVTLLRYNGTGEQWERIETRQHNATDEVYRYRTTLSEFSTFAVAQQVPAVEVDANVQSTTVTAGEDVTVTATVHNEGRAAATTEVPLVVDDSRVDARTVELGPGEQTEVTYEFSAGEPGQYSVAVGDAAAQSLTVEAQSTSTDTPGTNESGSAGNETTDASETGGSGAEGPGFGAGLALVALLVGSLALAARRAG